MAAGSRKNRTDRYWCSSMPSIRGARASTPGRVGAADSAGPATKRHRTRRQPPPPPVLNRLRPTISASRSRWCGPCPVRDLGGLLGEGPARTQVLPRPIIDDPLASTGGCLRDTSPQTVPARKRAPQHDDTIDLPDQRTDSAHKAHKKDRHKMTGAGSDKVEYHLSRLEIPVFQNRTPATGTPSPAKPRQLITKMAAGASP